MFGISALDLVGVATVLVSSIGAIIALRHWNFFRGSSAVLGRRLRFIFITDAGVYIATLFFGVWAFLILDAWDEYDYAVYYEKIRIALYTLRIGALGLNIWASALLYQHYMSFVDGEK